MKKAMLCMCACILVISLLAGCGNQVENTADTTKYNGKTYVSLSYPANVFYYDYNGNSHDNFEDVDGKYPIDSPKWDMIWNGGDLYCIKKRITEAEEYYANDDNYSWYALVDRDEEDNEINSCPITVTDAELQAIYDVEYQEKDLAVFFDEFEKLGSVFKISKDGVVRGTISVGKYKGHWYWKSEIIDESIEQNDTWPEYIQPLPDSLSRKIIEAE